MELNVILITKQYSCDFECLYRYYYCYITRANEMSKKIPHLDRLLYKKKHLKGLPIIFLSDEMNFSVLKWKLLLECVLS